MLSPLDLENKRVVTRKRKYDKTEVDEYLELVFENYKALYDEHQELQKKVKTLSDGIQYYRNMETTMQKALVLAEKTSKETKDAATLKADAIEKDAHIKAEKIIKQAADEYDRIRDKCITLVQQFNQYKLQLKQVATTQLELVNSDSFDVNSPDLDTLEPSDIQIESEEENEQPMNSAQEPEPVQETAEEEQKESEVSPQQSEYNSVDHVESDINVSEQVNTQETSQEKAEDEPEDESEEEVVDVVEDSSDSLGETTIMPDLRSEIKKAENKEVPSDEETISILTADTIDLSASIKKAQEQESEQQKEVKVVEPAMVETKDVKNAEVIEPLEIKNVKPLEVEPKNEEVSTLEPNSEKKDESHSLDALLQSMNMGGNKKNKKGQDDDPFEFLGSVDDF